MGWILKIYPVFLELIRKNGKSGMSRVIFYSNFKMNGHNLACFQKNTRWLIVIKHEQSARMKRKNNKLVLCFTTVMFWLLKRVCIYYPRPWNLMNEMKCFQAMGNFPRSRCIRRCMCIYRRQTIDLSLLDKQSEHLRRGLRVLCTVR